MARIRVGADTAQRRTIGGARRAAAYLAAALFTAITVLCAPASRAQDIDPILLQDFDPEQFNFTERLWIQIGLGAQGDYEALFDGDWGPRSQQALQSYARREYELEWVSNTVAALAADYGRRYVAHYDFRYDVVTQGPVSIFLPYRLVSAHAEEGFEAAWRDPQDSLRIALSLSRDIAFFHDQAARDIGSPEYAIRRERRWVTSIVSADGLYAYLRSDLTEFGWVTVIILANEDESRRAARVIASGYVAGSSPRSLDGPTPFVDQLLAALDAFEPAAPAGGAAAAPVVEAPAPAFPEATGSGSAFFINARQVVTNEHVVAPCRRVEALDGSLYTIERVDPRLDLALLRAPRVSDVWLRVAPSDGVRLGQEVYTAGYPFFDVLTRDLTVTRGVASSLSGLGGDTTRFTLTAPVQPGNSGGPVIDLRGAVVGVVVSRASDEAVFEATGAAPQNINYAVDLASLRAFMIEAGVKFQTGANDGAETAADGLPPEIAQAIVPLLCIE